MNMNQSPTKEELMELLAACDDKAGHHILWVNKAGDVLVTKVPEHLSPAGFEETTPQMQMRYETFQRGNGYVGKKAAKDQAWVSCMFMSLVSEWPLARESKEVEYIDSF